MLARTSRCVLTRVTPRATFASATCSSSSAFAVASVSSVSASSASRITSSAATSFSFSSSSSSLHARSFATMKQPKKATKLVGAELDRQVATLSGWARGVDGSKKDSISKSYTFDDFSQCWSIMSRVALLAEKMNHHPKWTNVYNSLKIELETHDVSGLSDFDIYMAQQIDTYVTAIRKPTVATK